MKRKLYNHQILTEFLENKRFGSDDWFFIRKKELADYIRKYKIKHREYERSLKELKKLKKLKK